MWVLVTDDMKVYLFKQGYLRTSSQAYKLDENGVKDMSVHLTNNAVQKYG